jgi:hypothetical protein
MTSCPSFYHKSSLEKGHMGWLRTNSSLAWCLMRYVITASWVKPIIRHLRRRPSLMIRILRDLAWQEKVSSALCIGTYDPSTTRNDVSDSSMHSMSEYHLFPVAFASLLNKTVADLEFQGLVQLGSSWSRYMIGRSISIWPAVLNGTTTFQPSTASKLGLWPMNLWSSFSVFIKWLITTSWVLGPLSVYMILSV